MPAKKKPSGTDADPKLTTLAGMFAEEETAIAFFEAKRWPNGPACPHCGSADCYRIKSKPGAKRPVRPGLLKCKACRKQFTVKVGTVCEESKIPLRKWLAAIHLMTSSKRGVSSRQIAREIHVTPKTAWFITHRIREAMRNEGEPDEKMSGAVEVEETYVGGKPRYRGQSKPGRGTRKKPTMVLVERDGRATLKPIDRVDGKTLRGEIIDRVDSGAHSSRTNSPPTKTSGSSSTAGTTRSTMARRSTPARTVECSSTPTRPSRFSRS